MMPRLSLPVSESPDSLGTPAKVPVYLFVGKVPTAGSVPVHHFCRFGPGWPVGSVPTCPFGLAICPSVATLYLYRFGPGQTIMHRHCFSLPRGLQLRPQ